MSHPTKMDDLEGPSPQIHHVETYGQVPLDLDDPHRAALENNPEHSAKLSFKSLMAVNFLILSFVAPLGPGFVVVSGIIVSIATDLGDVSSVTWIIGGWSIASSVSFSIAGRLSDIFGRRWAMIIGQGFTLIGAILAATAQSTNALIAGSTIIGWGLGIVFVGYAGISEILPNKWRSLGIGLTETYIGIPWTAGSVLIATLLDIHTASRWRWCYYITIMYSVVSIIGIYLFYFPPSRPQYDGKSTWQEIRELDYIGFLLYTAGLTTFLIGLTWAGTPAHPWKSASTLAPIIIGFLTLVACFVYDYTLAKQPLFPPVILNQVRDFTVLLVVVFVAGVVYYSMTALVPQASLYIFTDDPIEIGFYSLPAGISIVFFGGFLALFAGKIGHLRIQLLFYLVLQTAFIAAYSAAVPGNRNAWMALQFFGNGPFAVITIIAYVIAGLNVPLRHLGVASGLIGTFRAAGGSVGNAFLSTIFKTVAEAQVPKRVIAAGLSHGLQESSLSLLIVATTNNAVGVPGAFATVPGITPEIEGAASEAFKASYAYAFKRVCWSTIPFGVLAIACAWFIRDPSTYLTNHTAILLKNHDMLGRTIEGGENHHNTMNAETGLRSNVTEGEHLNHGSNGEKDEVYQTSRAA